MSKKKKHEILGYGVCRECEATTETRKGTNGGKTFYFSKYDYCLGCGKVWFLEEDKVYNASVKVGKKEVFKQNHKKSKSWKPKVKQKEQTADEIKEAKRLYWEWKDGLNQMFEHLNHD